MRDGRFSDREDVAVEEVALDVLKDFLEGAQLVLGHLVSLWVFAHSAQCPGVAEGERENWMNQGGSNNNGKRSAL